MRRNSFLFLAIACFLGIIAIFIIDGYMGIYDYVYVSVGESEQEISPEYWQSQPWDYPYPYHVGVEWGGSVHFRYKIDNRRFSTYSATVEASVWKSNEKIIDLFGQGISVPAFDTTTMEWTLPAQELEKAGLGIGEYTIRIKRGDMEVGRGIVLGFYSPVEQRTVPLPR